MCPTGRKIMAVVPRKIIGPRTFTVTFCSAGDDHLVSVTLDVVGRDNVFVLRAELLSQYGKPIAESRVDATWNDHRKGNTVTFMDIGGVTSRIEYKAEGGSEL